MAKGLRIGIYASELYDGGEVTYVRSLMLSLVHSHKIHSITLLINKDYDIFCEEFKDIRKIKPIKVSCKLRFGLPLSQRLFRYVLQVLRSLGFKYIFHSLFFPIKLDIIVFPYVSIESLFCKIPYVIIPQDLRRYHFRQDLSILRKVRYKLSDKLYKVRLESANIVVADSCYTQNDIVRFTSIPKDRVRIIPSFYSPNLLSLCRNKKIELTKKYRLFRNYIFYPAHFIAIKNHLNIIKSLFLIKERYGQEISLILVGSKKNNFGKVMNEIEKLGMVEQVKYLGYVPNEDIPCLYKLATCLVYASLFDPNGIPIWEAFYLGCPVVSSNVCALPEQVGDAGLLFDPNNVEDMAEKIYRIWTDEDLRKELIQKGYQRVKDMTLENYARQWEKVIEEALYVGK